MRFPQIQNKSIEMQAYVQGLKPYATAESNPWYPDSEAAAMTVAPSQQGLN
jgi:hypothetical protein